jgi:hypothetical protein
MQRELDVLPPPARAMAVYMKHFLPNAFEENQVKLKRCTGLHRNKKAGGKIS